MYRWSAPYWAPAIGASGCVDDRRRVRLGLIITAEREAEYQRLLSVIHEWATKESAVRGVAIVGSWARGVAQMHSDLDIVVLTDDLSRFIDDQAWVDEHFSGAENACRRGSRSRSSSGSHRGGGRRPIQSTPVRLASLAMVVTPSMTPDDLFASSSQRSGSRPAVRLSSRSCQLAAAARARRAS